MKSHVIEAAELQHQLNIKKSKVRSRILNAIHQVENYEILLNVAGYLREQGYRCDTRDLLEDNHA